MQSKQILLGLAVALGIATAQTAPTDALPQNPDLIVGKLPNGLSYYIRKNTEPKGRAELRLAVNAGSLQEDDDQQGLAHFLEHMLFNGTKRFPGLEIDNFIEKAGMRNGADLNAYTSFDETVYMLKVPTDDPRFVQTALDILVDWASAATLDPAEVQKESPVVQEEDRLRDKTANGRITRAYNGFLFGDSRYAQRFPIGDMNIVKQSPTAAIRRFYETWYRPDLMAVVAVGDFDPKAIEAQIQKGFGDLKNPASPKPLVKSEIAQPKQDVFKVITDKEFPATILSINGVRPAHPSRTLGDLKAGLISELFSAMLTRRLDDVANGGKAPLIEPSAGIYELTRFQGQEDISGQVQEGKEQAALEALTTELKRAKLGFDASELERAKKDQLAAAEKAYNERNKRNSADLAGAYVDSFLQGSIPISAETQYELTKRFITEINLEDINAFAKTFISGGRQISVIRPEKAGLAPLTEADLAKMQAAADALPVQAFTDAAVNIPLLDKLPTPVASKAENKQKEFTELTLANGVRVLYKKTDFKDDEVQFRAFSPGGASLVSDADYASAMIAADVVNNSGLGNLDRPTLLRAIAGKNANAVPYISDRAEGLTGNSSVKDLETLFQLVYLYFTQPRADQGIFDKQVATSLEQARNRSLTPNAALQDAIWNYLYGSNIRGRSLNEAALKSVSRDRVLQIYKERFADASNFTFMFVGSFEEAKLKAFAEQYLATLPSTNAKETWKNVFAKGNYSKLETTVYKGQDERATVVLRFGAPANYSVKDSVVTQALSLLLSIRFNDELREKLGGVYSASASVSLAREPNSEIVGAVQFTCDPKKVDELIKASLAILEEVKTTGITDENMAKVREQMRRGREDALRTNNFWMGRLNSLAQFSDFDVNDTTSYFTIANDLKSADLQQMARQVFTANYLQAVLLPESMKK